MTQQQFFNQANPSIPTSKKGVQKKLLLQDLIPAPVKQQHLTANEASTHQKGLGNQFMMSGKLQHDLSSLNPQYYYNMGDKVQSARGTARTLEEK